MSEFFKAEIKDKFLRYASEREDYFEIQLLYDEFLRPAYSIEYVEKLILEIIDFDHNLLDIMSGNGSRIFMVSATASTEDFVDEGGFTDLYIQEEEKWDNFLDQLASTRKLSVEEKQSLGKAEKITYRRERLLLGFVLGAVTVSFLFTIFSIAKSILKESPEDRIKHLEQRLDSLERENEKLLLDNSTLF